MKHAWYCSPIGILKLEADEEGLCFLVPDEEGMDHSDLDPELRRGVAWLDAYFSGNPRDIPVRLHLRGTPFQLKVWEEIRNIPFGETASYGEISFRLFQDTRASRAVGQALNRNPVLLIVPCHRIIRKNRTLGGFAQGNKMKEFLLKHESRID